MKLPKRDAVVVGSGAAGAVVAKELAENGFQVVLLERGPEITPEQDPGHDELRSQYFRPVSPVFGPDYLKHPRTFRYTDSEPARRVGPPAYSGYGRTAAMVGGATVSYGAMAWRFQEVDFRMRSHYGAVAGSSLEDWPISYQDLEPYYQKAEEEIGVSGLGGANPFEAPRRKPYPLPPIWENNQSRLLGAAAKRLGWHPFPQPLAILTRPYQGRPACIRCLFCVRHACEVGAKSSMTVTMIPKALETGLCTVRPNCMVREITVDGRGRPSGVAYFDADNKLVQQPAEVIVVSASATESPRLLLNSRSRFFPNGIGNRYDQVGRHLIGGHGPSSGFAIYDQLIDDGLGPGLSVAMDDFNHQRNDIIGGGVIANNSNYLHVPYGFSLMASRVFGPSPWGKPFKDFLRTYYRRAISVWGGLQQMPMANNRVELDPAVRDYWGIPVSRITHQYHPSDLKAGRFLTDRIVELLRETGALRVWGNTGGRGGVGEHQSGTCRMGTDPHSSVTDKYCRIHDVDNVYVIDGSSLTTNGGYNPSLTIQAVAFWAGAHLVREWRQGRYRRPSS